MTAPTAQRTGPTRAAALTITGSADGQPVRGTRRVDPYTVVLLAMLGVPVRSLDGQAAGQTARTLFDAAKALEAAGWRYIGRGICGSDVTHTRERLYDLSAWLREYPLAIVAVAS